MVSRRMARPSLDQLIGAKGRWRVSLAALNYRLHKIGLTTDWKYRDFCIEIAKKNYHKNEPQSVNREKSVVWQKVLNSLWSEGKTHKSIADDLNVPASEVGDLLLGVLDTAREENIQRSQPLTVVCKAERN